MQSISGYRLAPGHITVVALTEALYAIENFTRQADMPVGRDWMRPDNEADIIESVLETVDSLSGLRSGYGAPNFDWHLRGLTPLMVKYILDTYFSSTDFGALMTGRTFNREAGAFEVYQCTVNRKRYHDGGAEPALGGYDNLLLEFIKGTLIT